MNPFRCSFRMQFLLGFLACAGVVAYAIWTQLHDGLEPCNLCVFQRVSFALLALVFLVGALHAPRQAGQRRGYGMAAFIAATIGMGIAVRHVWVQGQPADMVSSCGPPIGFLQESVGMLGMIKKVLTGSGNCGTIDWTFLGLAMPAWSLICFFVLALWALYAGFSGKKVS